MATVSQINKALAARGIEERLRAGRGYYYFSEGCACEWMATSVYVYRASSLSIEQWLEEWSSLSGRPLPPLQHTR